MPVINSLFLRPSIHCLTLEPVDVSAMLANLILIFANRGCWKNVSKAAPGNRNFSVPSSLSSFPLRPVGGGEWAGASISAVVEEQSWLMPSGKLFKQMQGVCGKDLQIQKNGNNLTVQE